MKIGNFFIILTVTLGLLAGGCSPAGADRAPVQTGAAAEPGQALPANILTGGVKEYQAGLDYFPAKAKLTRAAGFKVEYHLNYKVLTVMSGWRDSGLSFRYILVQRGTPAPQNSGDALVIQIPVESVASLSTTHLPYLHQLGVVDRLMGVTNTRLMTLPEIIQRVEEKKIVSVGGDDNVNVELLLSQQPELVTTLGLGNPRKDNHPKLLEAGLKTVLIADFLEDSPLARAEWLKFMAAFFNREQQAEEIYARTAEKYEKMAGVAGAAAARPAVFMGYEINGTWLMPGGKSYQAAYLVDAGADYLWGSDTSNGRLPLAFESVFERAAKAEFWLNQSPTWTSTADILKADGRYAQLAAIRSGKIYNNNKRLNAFGGNDYNESGHANPDVVLADLIRIFHPHLLPDHELVYYRRMVNP